MNANYLTGPKRSKIYREMMIWWIIILAWVAFIFEFFLVKYYWIYTTK